MPVGFLSGSDASRRAAPRRGERRWLSRIFNPGCLSGERIQKNAKHSYRKRASDALRKPRVLASELFTEGCAPGRSRALNGNKLFDVIVS